MQEMSQQCKAAAQRLMETANMARSIAGEMQNGALVGDAGEAFTHAIQSALLPAVQKLSQKFDEVAKDITDAISDMQTQDKSTGGMF
jgi:uncharacterized protein YukE